MIKKGMIVKVIKGPRMKYFTEFEKWIDAHEDRTFYIERVLGNAAKLSKVGFWITKDFLKEKYDSRT